MPRALLLQSLAVWFLLLVGAVTLGALRVGVLEPRMPRPTSEALGVAGLCVVIVSLTHLFLRRTRVPFTPRHLVWIGAEWTALTVAFEFLFGRYAQGKSWPELFAAYDLTRGESWPVVLLVTFFAPPLVGRFLRARGSSTHARG